MWTEPAGLLHLLLPSKYGCAIAVTLPGPSVIESVRLLHHRLADTPGYYITGCEVPAYIGAVPGLTELRVTRNVIGVLDGCEPIAANLCLTGAFSTHWVLQCYLIESIEEVYIPDDVISALLAEDRAVMEAGAKYD